VLQQVQKFYSFFVHVFPALIACSVVCSCAKRPPSPMLPPNSRIPYQVEIEKELYTGTALFVAGSLVSFSSDPLDRVMLRAEGIRRGEAVIERIVSLESLVSEDERPTPLRIPFAFSLPASNLTDYSLEVLWGADADELQAESSEPQEIHVTQQRIGEEECDTEGCARIVLSAQLVNPTSEIVESVTLGLRFEGNVESEDLDLSAALPENEELVTVSRLGLAPGEVRALRVRVARGFERQISPLLHRIIPHVRVVSHAEPGEIR
jgi:hypothetical protein